jgi:hypothetical protein
VVVGDCITDAVVSPELQAYVPPDVVSVTDAPLQILPSSLAFPEVSATVIVGIGSGLTVMVVDVVEEQPSALVTVTV